MALQLHASQPAPHVLVLADQAVVRQALQRCLDGAVPAVEDRASIRETLARLRTSVPGLLVVHVDAGERSALEAVTRIRSRHPQLPLLVCVGRQELRCVAQLRRLHVNGFIAKHGDPAEVAQAAASLLAGRAWCSPGLEVFSPGRYVAAEPHERLTAREFLVFLELARGHSLPRIRTTLSLGPVRIARYRAGVLDKLQSRNESELTQYALRRGLID